MESEIDVKIYEKVKDSPVARIYDERKDFIIIGLTGRTGSGCTTVSKILNTEFFELELTPPKTHDFTSAEERKYAVLHKYAEVHWGRNKFTVIQITNIISSFLFEHDFDKFYDFVKTKNNSQDLLDKLMEFKQNYEYAHKTLSEIKTNLYRHNYINSYDEADKIREIFVAIIPTATTGLKKILEKYQYEESQLYTHLFQNFGSNIRASGDPYSETFDPNKIFIIAERTNKVIKAIRECEIGIGKSTLICIDAIRNKYEATFFKDRYSAFYLFSINTEEEHRLENLSHLTRRQIEDIDTVEYTKNKPLIQEFYTQNLKNCIEMADVHLHNPILDPKSMFYITEQVLRYIVLIMHPGIITPTNIERCMQIAYDSKLNSGCLSRQVGAVITDTDYSIKAVGWNDVPAGQVQCNLRNLGSLCKIDDKNSYSYHERSNDKFREFAKKLLSKIDDKKLRGRFFPFCFKDFQNAVERSNNQVYTRSLHAEENAFLQITKYGGQGIEGGHLFTTASPCDLCSKKAFQLGITKIYYVDPYPGIAKEHILKFGEGNNPELILFVGAIGKAYTTLYTQRIAYKDELSLLAEIEKKDYETIKNLVDKI